MKWRSAGSPKGSRTICTAEEKYFEWTGKLGRRKWGAAPIDVSRLFTSERWSISCTATSVTVLSHRPTTFSSSESRPSSFPCFMLKAAKRYPHITMCSRVAASESRKMSSSLSSMTISFS